ncbi:bifunctional phosphatase PAP2/diacylglycerol kinase family protein [Streptomyces benahoarensis]|uniref:Phosphatase PAP2 family protein n=1 Tax=Streptomyces benahoarensis TaxID=2595054 RepID=A0A553Z209_9ACTN|nr:bifunctional phosphatase PAP2/diacylglycerol kinase family protein [Streptomyces benahoarensis]TSB18193.1 phosphatase PAP2 family protein [Streptomyces benahoarensis]TSB35303.1 phosphatase PAP2 family protein [Streptomyces benahoarensis]
MRSLLSRVDRRLFAAIATREWPGAQQVLPRLTRGADHGLLWLGLAAGAAALGGRPARRAAVRGVASLAVASATVNTLGKRSVRRTRPLLDPVPVIRRLRRRPFTSSFPSGHTASAVAFATGVAFENEWWGLALAPLAASVAFSRVYTGVHYPGDVLAGAALGAGAAFAVRGLAPTRAQLAPPARPCADAPALPGGRGLFVVANQRSGQRGETRPDRAPEVHGALPRATVVTCGGPDAPDLGKALEEAAENAKRCGGALGVFGGDGTVNAAAAIAVRYGLPLAVLPGGTHNHFAYDLGIETVGEAARAVEDGEAVAVDLARFRAAPHREGRYFLNTFSIGAYPELVRLRERWAGTIGAWPAGVLAAWHVLRTTKPVSAEINGRRMQLWMLFVGNCSYRGLGLTPVRRHDPADGVLDVRVVRAGRLARTRLLVAALTGTPRASPVLKEARLRSLRIGGLPDGTDLAYDGEVTSTPGPLTLTKENEALTVYRLPPES